MTFNKMSKKSTKMRITLYILALLALAGCATSPIPESIRSISLPIPTGCRVYKVMGPTHSMHPLIEIGDQLIVDPRFPYENLRPGDVCVYFNPLGIGNGVLIHECYKHSGDDWLMWGINNRHVDALGMTRQNYLGKVMAKLNK